MKDGNIPKAEYSGEVDAPLIPRDHQQQQEEEEEVFDIDEVPKNVSLVDEEDAKRKKREVEVEQMMKYQVEQEERQKML